MKWTVRLWRVGLSLAAVLSCGAGVQSGVGADPTVRVSNGVRTFVALESDSRLDRRVSIVRDKAQASEVLDALTRSSKVPLRLGKNELGSLSCRFRSVPLRDVLDAIARSGDHTWERQPQGVLVLRLRRTGGELDIFRPRTPEQAEVFRQGREVLSEFEKLPSGLKNGMLDAPKPGSGRRDDLQPRGVPFAALPASLQQSLTDFLSAQGKYDDTVGASTSVTADVLPDSRIHLENRVRNGATQYWIKARHGNSEGGGWFHVFHDAQEGYQVTPLDALPKVWYNDEEDAATREAALRDDPRLRHPVTLQTRAATLDQALHALTAQFPVPFLSVLTGVKGREPVRRSWDLRDVPLSEALDRLTRGYEVPALNRGEVYRHTWGVTPGGVLVVHPGRPEAPGRGGTPSRTNVAVP